MIPSAALSRQMTRLAHEALLRLRAEFKTPKQQRDVLAASRQLPLLLRRHGLAATSALWWNWPENPGEKERAQRAVVAAFVDALAEVAPIGSQTTTRGRIEALTSESLTAYLLHSRLALKLADVWFALAEPMLPEAAADAAARRTGNQNSATEVAHEPA